MERRSSLSSYGVTLTDVHNMSPGLGRKPPLQRKQAAGKFTNYGIPWQENNGVLVENCDGVYNGVLFEFKLNINDLNKTLFQAIKYLSRMRVHGESVPATILLVSLNNKTAYECQ